MIWEDERIDGISALARLEIDDSLRKDSRDRTVNLVGSCEHIWRRLDATRTESKKSLCSLNDSVFAWVIVVMRISCAISFISRSFSTSIPTSISDIFIS